MNLDMQSILHAAIRAREAYRLLNQYKESIDEDMRRKELRIGSIDVEFRVLNK
jgi:hypothetical protein